MSRKPALSPAELRAELRRVTLHNRELSRDLRAAREALRQQHRHLRQLGRVLERHDAAPRRAIA